MRQDNDVKSLRSLSSHALNLLRARLIGTSRRAAAVGLAAAISTLALLMSITHGLLTYLRPRLIRAMAVLMSAARDVLGFLRPRLIRAMEPLKSATHDVLDFLRPRVISASRRAAALGLAAAISAMALVKSATHKVLDRLPAPVTDNARRAAAYVRPHLVNNARRSAAFTRTHLISTPRRAAAFGLAASIGVTGLLMSTTHQSAANAELAKAAAVQQAAADRPATTQDPATTRSYDRPMTGQAAPQAVAPPQAAEQPAAEQPTAVQPAAVQPVAGLDQTQMNNATTIVRAGQELGVSERGQVVAVATAMQESNLYNKASYVVPESLQYDHEGYGSDYDSVGLFQQRYTTGWGSVKSIMDPSESSKKFYRALMQVPDWQDLPVTVAAQTVQGSAFPDAYAPHEWAASTVVDAVNAQH